MAVKGTVSIVFVMLYLARKIARNFIYLSQFRLHVSFTHAHSTTWRWKRTGEKTRISLLQRWHKFFNQLA